MNVIDLFVIYRCPRDYPKHWVVRPQSVASDANGQPVILNWEIASLCDSLEEARGEIPPEMTLLDRNPDDDLAIYEVWL